MFSIFVILLFFIVNVSSKAPELVPFMLKNVLEQNEPFSLVCSLRKGSQPINFEWFKNGNKVKDHSGLSLVSQPTLSVLTFAKVQTLHSGNYSCVASNPDGSSKSFTFLQVKGKRKYCAKWLFLLHLFSF